LRITWFFVRRALAVLTQSSPARRAAKGPRRRSTGGVAAPAGSAERLVPARLARRARARDGAPAPGGRVVGAAAAL